MSSSIAAEHLRELAGRKSKLYDLMLVLEEQPGADESSFESLASIVDRAVFNEISLDAEALGGLVALIKGPAEDLASTLAVLAVALSEAEPDRDRLQLLLSGFPRWLGSASPAARRHFLAIVPNIAALSNELGESGVESLIACFNGCSSDADADLIARCIVRYQETTGDILKAAAELGSLLIRADARSRIDRLLIAAPPDAMLDSKEARALLPAMAALKNPGAVGVSIAVARQNHSSALNLSRQFPALLAPLPPESQAAYLNAFENIVDEAGISLVGYGSKQLPALFQKAGRERAGQFVTEGLAIARRYGKVAAQEFFEQKTAASKQAYPLG